MFVDRVLKIKTMKRAREMLRKWEREQIVKSPKFVDYELPFFKFYVFFNLFYFY